MTVVLMSVPYLPLVRFNFPGLYLVLVLTQSGPRYGDYKCIHDRTHRVCAKLVDNSNGRCDALSWNSNGQSFWQITGQERWNWKDRICNAPNPGDSWCICLWATANLIDAVGCDNVHIDCAATDVEYVKSRYYDYRWSLSAAKECIERKCQRLASGKYINRPRP